MLGFLWRFILIVVAVVALLLRRPFSRSVGVAEYGLRAIGNLAVRDDNNRRLLGAAGACEGESMNACFCFIVKCWNIDFLICYRVMMMMVMMMMMMMLTTTTTMCHHYGCSGCQIDGGTSGCGNAGYESYRKFG